MWLLRQHPSGRCVKVEGSVSVGRCPEWNIRHLQVSRKHALVQRKAGGGVLITATGGNALSILRGATGECVQLKRGCSTEICEGDKVMMLSGLSEPWFSVEQESEKGVSCPSSAGSATPRVAQAAAGPPGRLHIMRSASDPAPVAPSLVTPSCGALRDAEVVDLVSPSLPCSSAAASAHPPKRQSACAASANGTPAPQQACKEPCVICTEVPQAEVGRLPCGHSFCLACIQTWAGVATTCPLCKAAFTFILRMSQRGHCLGRLGVSPRRQRIHNDDDGALAGGGSGGEGEATVCEGCGQGGREHIMLLCDACDAPWHTTCVGLDAVPPGDWLCPRCLPSVGSPQRALARLGYGRRGGAVHASPIHLVTSPASSNGPIVLSDGLRTPPGSPDAPRVHEDGFQFVVDDDVVIWDDVQSQHDELAQADPEADVSLPSGALLDLGTVMVSSGSDDEVSGAPRRIGGRTGGRKRRRRRSRLRAVQPAAAAAGGAPPSPRARRPPPRLASMAEHPFGLSQVSRGAGRRGASKPRQARGGGLRSKYFSQGSSQGSADCRG